MAGLNIGRMRIDAPGLTADEGEALARLVADRLGQAALRIDRPARAEQVQTTIAQPTTGGLDALAESIAADVLRRLGAAV